MGRGIQTGDVRRERDMYHVLRHIGQRMCAAGDRTRGAEEFPEWDALVRCPAMNLHNSLAFEARCGVARRRNSAAITPPRALPRSPPAARIIEVHHWTAHY